MTEVIKKRVEMMNRGEIPDGYKKTKVGIVPSEWDECRFKQKFLRLTRKNKENNTNVLTISAQYGLINQEDFFNNRLSTQVQHFTKKTSQATQRECESPDVFWGDY